MGNEYTTADDLVGGINEPVNDDTFIPLTEEELANLPGEGGAATGGAAQREKQCGPGGGCGE